MHDEKIRIYKQTVICNTLKTVPHFNILTVYLASTSVSMIHSFNNAF